MGTFITTPRCGAPKIWLLLLLWLLAVLLPTLALAQAGPTANPPSAAAATPFAAPGIKLADTMGFEQCLDLRMKPGLGSCGASCPLGSVPTNHVRFLYNEPMALIEGREKPYQTYFDDPIFNPMWKFLLANKVQLPEGFLDSDATATGNIYTSGGAYVKRYLETHVWGIQPMTRFATKSGLKSTALVPLPDAMTSMLCEVGKAYLTIGSVLNIFPQLQGSEIWKLYQQVQNLANIAGDPTQALGQMAAGLKLPSGVTSAGNALQGMMRQFNGTIKEWGDAISQQTGNLLKPDGLSSITNCGWLTSQANQLSQQGTNLQTPGPNNPQPPPTAGNGQQLQQLAGAMRTRQQTLSRQGQCNNAPIPAGVQSAMDTISEGAQVLDNAAALLRRGYLSTITASMLGQFLPHTLVPSYLSELDRPTWQTNGFNVIGSIKAAAAATPGMCLIASLGKALGLDRLGLNPLADSIRTQLCVGVWGSLEPKIGTVWANNSFNAAGVTSYRAFRIAEAWQSLPATIAYNTPKLGMPKFNLDFPFKTKKCYPVGTVDPRWESQWAQEGLAGPFEALGTNITAGLEQIQGALSAATTLMNGDRLSNITTGAKAEGFVKTYWKPVDCCAQVCVGMAGGVALRWKKK